jgi:GNAT superfamily N-acetyltransferase
MRETRLATVEDAGLITRHRRAMFEAMGRGTAEVLEEMSRNFEPWVRPRLEDGRYLGWITVEDGRAVASAGLLMLEWPPVPLDPAGTIRGYLLNVFVEREYRRRGLARALVEMSIEEARRRGIRVVSLHASDEGRALYERMGFAMKNEMQIAIQAPGIIDPAIG